MLSKITNLIKFHQYHIFLVICITLIGITSYNLGKINSVNKTPLQIGESALLKNDQKADIYTAVGNRPSAKTISKPLDMRVVVSKASTSKKYHYSWCSSWKRIKPENQVWFNTEAEAIAAGYTLAGNCTK